MLQRYPLAPSQLLSRILDRPELVSAVRELPAATLSRLIDRVGLEDCGELIALATTEQLEAMFDEDLWRADASGFEERFDPQRFALWLQVMAEAGDEFLARRLCELPLDLLTLAVNRLVLVIDMDALLNCLAGARDEAGQIESALEHATAEEWEEFRLIARDLEAWEEVWNALLLLDREHHERLRGILERCCAMSTEYINGQGGLYEVLTSDEMLENDALAERDDRRATQGYVSLGDARGFLELARGGGQALAERDPITAAYFRALDTTSVGGQAAARTRRLTGSGSGADVEALMRLIAASDSEPGARRGDGQRVLRGSTENRARLPVRAAVGKEAQLADAAPERRNRARRGTAKAGKSSTRRHASASDGQSGGAAAGAAGSRQVLGVEQPSALEVAGAIPTKGPLAAALTALSSADLGAHTARLEELGYLANVLIAGCKHEGRKLRPVEALEAAISTCNLGLELWERPERPRGVESDTRLLQQVGCDRLFRVAWPALQREVVQVAARTLMQRCANLDAGRARQVHSLIKDDSVSSLGSVCDASELELDEETFDALLALAEALPWQTPLHSAADAADASPWIASSADFARARQRLAELAGARSFRR